MPGDGLNRVLISFPADHLSQQADGLREIALFYGGAAPHGAEDLVLRHHAPSVFKQQREQVELLGGEVHCFAVMREMAHAHIQRKGLEPIDAPSNHGDPGLD